MPLASGPLLPTIGGLRSCHRLLTVRGAEQRGLCVVYACHSVGTVVSLQLAEVRAGNSGLTVAVLHRPVWGCQVKPRLQPGLGVRRSWFRGEASDLRLLLHLLSLICPLFQCAVMRGGFTHVDSLSCVEEGLTTRRLESPPAVSVLQSGYPKADHLIKR